MPSGNALAEVQFDEAKHPDFRCLLSALRDSQNPNKQNERSFVQAAAALARQFKGQPGDLLAVETGLRAAVEIALQSGWRGPVGEIMPVLRLALLSRRNYAALARLLERCVTLFTSLRAGKIRMRKGWETVGMQLIAACVEVSRLRGRLWEARGWQSMRVDFLRRKRAGGLMRELSLLAELHLAAGSPAAIGVLLKGYRLARRAGDRAGAVDCAYRIAGALAQLEAGKDLRRARRWITICRRLLDPGDAAGQGRCFLLEGKIAYEYFVQAQKDSHPERNQAEQLVERLNEALGCTFEGLEMMAQDEPLEAARAHEMLGFLYLQASQMKEEAVRHYDQAVALFEAASDTGAASRAQFNLAVALFLLGDVARARGYTVNALHGFESLGPEFLMDAQKAQRLLQRYG
jgi:tetratricopeptide (TPR) repeat protein